MPPYLFDIYDPRRCRVYLTEERWRHITDGHPEITDANLLRQTVESPWFISADTQDDLVEVYYRKGLYPGKPQLFVRVVVRQGKVITAYVLGSLKRGEKVIWMSGSS